MFDLIEKMLGRFAVQTARPDWTVSAVSCVLAAMLVLILQLAFGF
jgi:hypothetical protein